jgi:nicotinamidase-related amidase
MGDQEAILRSPELMSAGDTALLVVDVQERLVPAIGGNRRVVWNIGRLIEGAKLLGLPVIATEQYPAGLGPTVPELAARIGAPIPSKIAFSSLGCPGILDGLDERGITKLLVCGIEAHVCVQQTVLDLMAAGWKVYLAVDAVGSRFEIDYRTALARMDASGATLTSTEAALFEWCQVAGTPQFKQISQLVRQPVPAE